MLLTELFITSGPIIETIFNKPRIQPRKQLTDTQSIAPQIVTDYVTQLATEFSIKDIKVIIDSEHDTYAKSSYNSIIYINPEYAYELELLLKNSNRLSEDEKRFNMHTNGIYHELTHELRDSEYRFLMYKAIRSVIGATITSSALSHVIKKHIPSIQKNFTIKNSFKIGRSAFTFSLASHLMNQKISYLDNLLYAHYEELQADNGIPNKKNLLETQAELYEAKHEALLKRIEKVKTVQSYSDIITLPKDQKNRFELFAMKTIPLSWFNNPYLTSAIFHADDTHPSDIQRALHFRKRIKELNRLEALE